MSRNAATAARVPAHATRPSRTVQEQVRRVVARWRAAGIFGEQLCHKARDLATAIADDMRHASNPEDLADGRVMLDTLALEVAGAGVSEVAGSLASTSSAAEVAP